MPPHENLASLRLGMRSLYAQEVKLANVSMYSYPSVYSWIAFPPV